MDRGNTKEKEKFIKYIKRRIHQKDIGKVLKWYDLCEKGKLDKIELSENINKLKRKELNLNHLQSE